MLYLHLLDRELIEAVRWEPKPAEVRSIVRLAALLSGESLYASLSSLWENATLSGPLRDELLLMARLDELHVVSRERSIEDFLESRRQLYFHDQGRYPAYFGSAHSSLARLHPDWHKAQGTTKTLARELGMWAGSLAAEPQTVRLTRLGPPVLAGLKAREGRAVTIALFRPHLEQAGLVDSGFAESRLAREISAGYVRDYVTSFGGHLISGIRELSPYGLLHGSSIDYDIRLWREMAAVLGLTRLTSPEDPDLHHWSLYLSARGAPEFMHLAMSSRAIFRGIRAALVARRKDTLDEEETVVPLIVERIRKAVHVQDRLEHSPRTSADVVAIRSLQHLDLLRRRLAKSDRLIGEAIERERDVMDLTQRATDLLLVTVNDTETTALRRELERIAGTGRPFFGKHQTYWDYGPVSGVRVAMVRTAMGSGGVGGSALTVREAIEERQPTSVVAVGIAFAMEEDHPVGQLLLSEILSGYEARREGTDDVGRSIVIRRGTKTACSPRLLSSFRDARLSDIGISCSDGELLSGEALVDSRDFKAQLKKDFPEAIGGEMEGAGVQAAADRAGTAWIVAKAVSDYAMNKSTDNRRRQELAATVSAKAVVHVLQSGAFGQR